MWAACVVDMNNLNLIDEIVHCILTQQEQINYTEPKVHTDNFLEHRNMELYNMKIWNLKN